MPRDESRLTWQRELEESAGNKHPSPHTLKSAAELNQQLLNHGTLKLFAPMPATQLYKQCKTRNECRPEVHSAPESDCRLALEPLLENKILQ